MTDNQTITVSLTRDQWNSALTALASWSGQQVCEKNNDGANDTLTIYNSIVDIVRGEGFRLRLVTTASE